MNCDLSEWYKGNCGGNFYHSNTVLYPHYFTMNNFSKYHTNDNNEKCWGYAATPGRAEAIGTKCVAIKNGLTMFNFVGYNIYCNTESLWKP